MSKVIKGINTAGQRRTFGSIAPAACGGFPQRSCGVSNPVFPHSLDCVYAGMVAILAHFVNNIQGYLAYNVNTVVGWCNANTKQDCQKCASWQRFMGYVPLDGPGIKVKSIFCFVIAPEIKQKGIATRLLEHVYKDAAQDGFDVVEAYPYKEQSYQPSNFDGYFEMYKKNGFYVFAEAERGLIMRKKLTRDFLHQRQKR